jgi:hypothetical protein
MSGNHDAKMTRQQRRKLERSQGGSPRVGPPEDVHEVGARAIPPGRPPSTTKVVPVQAGYPEFGWRDELRQVEADRRRLKAREEKIAGQALAAGCTLSELARALGISRQSAHARYARLRPVVRSH